MGCGAFAPPTYRPLKCGSPCLHSRVSVPACLPLLQMCDATGPDGKCTKDERYRGLWEVPVWVLQVRRCRAVDRVLGREVA